MKIFLTLLWLTLFSVAAHAPHASILREDGLFPTTTSGGDMCLE